MSTVKKDTMQIGRWLTVALTALLLAACATTEKPKQQAPEVISQPTVKQKIYTSDDYLALAKANNDSPTYLLMAAQAANKEQRFDKSLVIGESMKRIKLPLEISQQLLLIEANNLLSTGDLNEAEATLNSPLASTPEIIHQVDHLKALLYSRQKRYVESLRYLFRVEKSVENNELELNRDDVAKTIWYQLNQLPDITLDTFEYDPYTNAKAWLQLVRITRLYTGSPSVLQSQLKQWYELHPFHAAMNVLPESFQQSLSVVPFNPHKIAVILPFGGKLRKQAMAIRNGLLMASRERNDLEMVFIDSELPLTTVEQKVQAEQVEFAIGPLLKEKVEQFAASEVFAQLPTLFLNRVNLERDPNKQHFFFGLIPEDEAQQAATTLFALGYKKPSIIAPNNSLGKRLSEMFSKTWMSQRSSTPLMTPEVSYYTDQAQMQKAVKDILEVDQSRQRISHIKSLIGSYLGNRELYTETRNRKDLDVIYVIGNEAQTRLLKPFIDVNTSPFANPLPVYACSRSHDLKKRDSDKRDLRGLTLTEMPWLLNGEIRYRKQRTLHDHIWPSLDSQEMRLFALGYDALTLIDRLAQLRVLNGLNESGMSGLISVDENGNINLERPWARYNDQGDVEQVKLD